MLSAYWKLENKQWANLTWLLSHSIEPPWQAGAFTDFYLSKTSCWCSVTHKKHEKRDQSLNWQFPVPNTTASSVFKSMKMCWIPIIHQGEMDLFHRQRSLLLTRSLRGKQESADCHAFTTEITSFPKSRADIQSICSGLDFTVSSKGHGTAQLILS